MANFWMSADRLRNEWHFMVFKVKPNRVRRKKLKEPTSNCGRIPGFKSA